MKKLQKITLDQAETMFNVFIDTNNGTYATTDPDTLETNVVGPLSDLGITMDNGELYITVEEEKEEESMENPNIQAKENIVATEKKEEIAMKNMLVRVSYLDRENILHTKGFASVLEARAAFQKIAQHDLQCKMEYNQNPPILMDSYKWTIGAEICKNETQLREEIASVLKEAKIRNDKIETILLLNADEIINAVNAENFEPFTDLCGIGVKTASDIITALKGKFGAIVGTDNKGQFRERIRVTLNPNYGPKWPDFWVKDNIRKRMGSLEEEIYKFSGDPDALISVTSMIPETSASMFDLAAQDRLQAKKEVWERAVENGLVVNGFRYKPLGNTPNGAKFCDTVWVKEQYYDEAVEIREANRSPKWLTTCAKEVGYMAGLELPFGEKMEVPFLPKDFEFFHSLEVELEDKVAWNTVDGNVTYSIRKVVQNAFDGMIIMHVSRKMQLELVQRLMAGGMEEQRARRSVKRFIKILRTFTIRTAGGKMKGAVCVFFDIHQWMHDHGIHTINGRDVDDIVFFCDETVLKAGFIGKNDAYESRAAWEQAVSNRFDVFKLLKEHDIQKKDVSYQVIQSNHKASRKTIEKLAAEQADEINRLHNVEGAITLLPREQRFIATHYPELLNVRSVQEAVSRRFYHKLDKAFAGKRVGTAAIGMIFCDVVAMAEHIAGLPVKGCLPAGTVYNRAVKKCGEVAMWRSPQLDPGALCVRNIQNFISGENDKYFTASNSIMLSAFDTMVTRVRGDFDGDKMGYSYDPTLIQMFKETHDAFGDYLTDWEVFKAPKTLVNEAALKEYFKRMVNGNDLGLTCTHLNAMYNGILEHRKTGEIKLFDPSYDSVSNLTTKANNLVDASKHGMKAFADNKDVLVNTKEWKAIQPRAKVYRDKAKELAESLSKGGSRKALDALAVLPEELRHGTLNIYTGALSDLVDREFNIKDLPKEEFDYRKLMFCKEKTMRGLSGLVRKGKIYSKALGYRVDEGLFNSIARRTAKDWKAISSENDTSSRNMSQHEYESMIRASALAEIKAFAETCGKTLKDAYDVITWRMFCDADHEYADYQFVRDRMWAAYWVVFGGMAKDAAVMNAELDEYDVYQEMNTYEADEDEEDDE